MSEPAALILDEAAVVVALKLAVPYIKAARDLAALSGVNHELLQDIRSQDTLWKPFVPKFPCHDKPLEYSGGRLSDNPRLARHQLSRLLIPTRQHGPIRDHYTATIHNRDRVARRHDPKLVLQIRSTGSDGTVRLNPETGVLQDLFRPAHFGLQFGLPQGEYAWLDRSFPCTCDTCHNTTIGSTDEMIAHCATFEHLNASSENYGGPIPEEFVDPRHQLGFDEKSTFEKAKELNLYRSKVLRLLKAPLDHPEKQSESFLARVENMRSGILSCTAELLERGDITEDDATTANSNTTSENIVECLVDGFVVNDFLSDGVEGQYCRDIVRDQGYDGFDGMHGSSSYNSLYNCVTELDIF